MQISQKNIDFQNLGPRKVEKEKVAISVALDDTKHALLKGI